MGVPEERCVVVAPGSKVRIKDIEILVLESFDRTMLVTEEDPAITLKGKLPDGMDQRAVNYLIKTPAGTVYHSGDSHYSNYYAKHGNDKMTSSDILRMAEALRTKVMIPVHHDIWSNFQADPNEIVYLYRYRKDRMRYQFKPYIWQVGGGFVYPDNKDDLYFQFDRGFKDCFVGEPDVPFTSFL